MRKETEDRSKTSDFSLTEVQEENELKNSLLGENLPKLKKFRSFFTLKNPSNILR